VATSTTTSKGQITIPAVVRAALGVPTSGRVEFVQVKQGRFELLAATLPVSALKGMIKKPSKPVTLEEMKESNGAKAK
jgi:bifunctional DNA-binding transcriptional regulator/antitoxin component of YhaV-PrlF toxin-antitoxin module